MPAKNVGAENVKGSRDNGRTETAKSAILDRLVASARELVPSLRDRAPMAEQARRLPDETIREFNRAGFFKIFQPARFGGYELDYGPAQLLLCSELGRACGSSAWVMSVVACHAWIVGMFPMAAQEEVWGESQDTLLSTALAPERAEFESVSGGFKLSGHWKFSSGVDFVEWALVGAALRNDKGPPQPYLCMIPKRDFEIIDTWFVGGLRGTGSKDLRVSGAFVPEHRAVRMDLLCSGKGPGTEVNSSHIYRLPLFSVFPYNICAPAFGIARGVLEGFTERARTQVSARMGARIAAIEANQLHVAESAAQVDSAWALLMQDADEFNRLVRSGAELSYEQRARYKRDLSYAARQCMLAVDALHYLSGAHALFEENPLQRAFRDVHAVNAQVGLRWNVNALPYGRIALGEDYKDPLL